MVKKSKILKGLEKKLKRFKNNIFLLSIFFLGCAGAIKRPVTVEEAGTVRHDTVIALEHRNLLVDSFKALTKIRYNSHLFGSTGQAVILLKRPFYLRVDGLGEFGTQDPQIALLQSDMIIYWVSANRYFKGLAGPEEMESFLHLSLPPDLLIQLLSGVIPLEEETSYILLKDRKTGDTLLKGNFGEVTVHSFEEGQILPVRYLVRDSDGSRRYQVEYFSYEKSDGFWMPKKLKAQFWDPQLKIEIDFEEIHVNPKDPKIDRSLFEVKIPADAMQINAIQIQN